MKDMQKHEIIKAIKKVLEGAGHIPISDIGKEFGLSKSESETKLVFLMIQHIGSYAKDKKVELENKSMESLTRDDIKNQIVTLITTVTEKMKEKMKKEDFEITESFRNDIKTFLSVFSEYSKFEGLNMATKIEVDGNITIDTSKIGIEDAKLLLEVLQKAKKVAK